MGVLLEKEMMTWGDLLVGGMALEDSHRMPHGVEGLHLEWKYSVLQDFDLKGVYRSYCLV